MVEKMKRVFIGQNKLFNNTIKELEVNNQAIDNILKTGNSG